MPERLSAPESLGLDGSRVERGHHFIVELEPLLPILDVRVVVPGLGCSIMNNHSAELEVVVGVRVEIVGVGIIQVLGCVLLHVEVEGEGAVVIYLVLLHQVIVELESLQDYDKDIWESLHTNTFDSLHFLFAFLAKVGIFSLKNLPLDVPLKGLFEGGFVLDVQPYRGIVF